MSTLSLPPAPRIAAPMVERWLRESERELCARGLSAQTRRIYLPKIRRLLTELDRAPADIAPDDLLSYLEQTAAERRPSPATLAQTLSVLRFFFRYVHHHPALLLALSERPGAVAPPPPVVPRRGVLRLLAAAKTRRERVLVGLLYGSGLRLSECRRVRLRDVDGKRLRLLVRDRDGLPARLTVLSPHTWTQVRPMLGPATERPVLPGRGTRALGGRALQKTLQGLARRGGLGPGITPRVLRRSFAQAMRDNGLTPAEVEALLGLRRGESGPRPRVPGSVAPPPSAASPL